MANALRLRVFNIINTIEDMGGNNPLGNVYGPAKKKQRTDSAQKRLGRPLPATLAAFYAAMNGCAVIWTLGEYEGALCFSTLTEFLAGGEGVFWRSHYREFMAQETIDLLERSHPLESIEGASSSVIVDLSEEDGRLFLVEREDVRPLDVSLEDYIEWRLATFGFQGGHRVFDSTFRGQHELAEKLRKCLPNGDFWQSATGKALVAA